MKTPPDAFQRLLATWRLTPRADDGFRGKVWARIQQAQPVSWSGFARLHAPWVAGALALALVGGAVAGREQARSRVQLASSRFADTYVRSLDGRVMRNP